MAVSAAVRGPGARAQQAEPARAVREQARVRIANIMPFASADRVRVDVRLELEEVAPGLRMGLLAEIREHPGGELLWEGTCGIADFRRQWSTTVSRVIPDLQPKLWSPTSPQLYDLTVTVGLRGRGTTRFGFRSVAHRRGQIFLNGKPVFLRGNAINPPGRGMDESVASDRAFAEAYIRDMKARNINCIRTVSPVWLDMCDELGMLAITGIYGAPPGATYEGGSYVPPLDLREAVREYKQKFFQYSVYHPSVIAHIVSSDMPTRGRYGEMFTVFLDSAYMAFKEWDPHRLYFTNAGRGGGDTGDVSDWHAYPGWYGGNFLSYYRLRQESAQKKPMTFSECVGAFTESGGRFRVQGRQLAASLAWGGHTPNPVEDALEYQAVHTKRTVEICRRLRNKAGHMAGVLPFTSIFYHWDGVRRYEDMQPKPVADAMRRAFQPVLLSWECWRPHVYAGSTLDARAHVVNDSDSLEDMKGLTLKYSVCAKGGDEVRGGETNFPDVAYFRAERVPVRIALPGNLRTGDYTLKGELLRGGQTIAANEAEGLFIADPADRMPNRPPTKPVFLYDPVGVTGKALVSLRFALLPLDDPEKLMPGMVCVIGANVWDDTLSRHKERLRQFVRAGGRILLLRQTFERYELDWLGAGLEVVGSGGDSPVCVPGMYINPERPDLSVFSGIPRRRLRLWSDTTGWNEDCEGNPHIYPAMACFVPDAEIGLENVAVLANCGRGLSRIVLCEVFEGEGSVVVCGLDLVGRFGLDPVADKMLRNLVAYVAEDREHERYPLVDAPIQWGDYVSERGVVSGSCYGMLVNAAKIPAPKEGRPEITSTQTVPRGRRPYGPFYYSGDCGVVTVNPKDENGIGQFFVRVAEGKRRLRTLVENPDPDRKAELTVTVNGVSSERESFAPGTKGETSISLSPHDGELAVTYAGSRHLVILSSHFE